MEVGFRFDTIFKSFEVKNNKVNIIIKKSPSKVIILNRLLYFFQCINNHKKGSDDSCEISNPYLTILNLDTFDKSPSRLLCDGLWNSIDYGNLKLQLNSDLNFFDIV